MDRLKTVLERIERISKDVRVVAVSKYSDTDAVKELYDQGQLEFGENIVQELSRKAEILSNLDIKWHFIGNLQSNKINHLLKLKPTLWQSCNSLKLATKVDKRLSFKLDTLLEINIADESSKMGLDANRSIEIYHEILESCLNLNLVGIMCMGAHSDEIKKIAKSFEDAFKIYESLSSKFGAKICSMGMSSDYEIAVKSGSNMVRLGSVLFK
ncbi:MAG: YggS family pyridoxal phosphate-dependent enzyme [Campylobacter sp.]|nr:YggS family pyridoxal phosphate-dependent enzyme [Campylobacter sp.]